MATVIATPTDSLRFSESPSSPTISRSLRKDGLGSAVADRRPGPKIAIPVRPAYHPRAKSPSLQGRDLSSSMPVSTGSQSLLSSLPSFMSVFGDGSSDQTCREVGTAATQVPNKSAGFNKRPNSTQQTCPSSFRRDSASTFESVESSPTTTISTAGTSITEPSPSSSPESPNPSLPLLSSKAQRTKSSPAIHGIMNPKEQFSSSFPLLPGVEGTESPHKKMRNTKNLSVNTAASNRQASQLSKIALSNASSGQASHASSAPPTPAFIVPPKAPRKKPSNLGLTITTPESSSSNPSSYERPIVVPPTPSEPQIRTLRMLQTNSNASPFSPTHAPEGGMRLPPISNGSSSGRFGKQSRPPLSVSPLSSFDATVASPITKQTLDHVEEECDYDVPLSQEAKSPAYPQGPVCIYDPNVYLYLEPTQVEARVFDVIINVAREVKNPFTVAAEEKPEVESLCENPQWDSQGANIAGRDSAPEPLAATEASFGSAIDAQLEDAPRSAPTTPKATTPEPEYVHVPWDHNANVVDDLLKLCGVIEDRVRQDKKVLIHCQCGVSRSASLVVAYGIYRNPQLTVQEAYDVVKTRSRWIGPNMNLIYQLSEFKIQLNKSVTSIAPAWHSWRTLAPLRPDSASTFNNDDQPKSARVIPQKSLSAPSHMDHNGLRTSSLTSSGPTYLTVQSMNGDITPGPSSAPPRVSWLSPNQPVESPAEAGENHIQISAEPPTLPKLMDIDTTITLSPLLDNISPISELQTPPAGAVVSDLQEVAKDLDERKPKSHAESSPAESTDMEVDASSAQSPAQRSEEGSRIGKIPSPSLPGGFSSLLSRRQGSSIQRLPLRQSVNPLPTAASLIQQPLPAAPFNPLLHDDVPPTPSLLSPRAAEFTASPFHRTAAGDLAGSSVIEQQGGLMSPSNTTFADEDPRSPHQQGEAPPITRSIFDMLESRRLGR